MTDADTPTLPTTTETNDIAKRRRVHELTSDLADLAKDAADRFVELHDIGVDTRDVVRLLLDHLPHARETFSGQEDGLSWSIDSCHAALIAPRNPTDDQRREFARLYNVLLGKYRSTMDGSEMGDMADRLSHQLTKLERDPSHRRSPMRNLIYRLFDEAPKLTDDTGKPVEGQAPAVDCSVILRTLPMQLSGALSKTPEGTLRLLSPTEIQDPQTKRSKVVMAEQFFEIDDVLTIVLQRDISMSQSERRIIS